MSTPTPVARQADQGVVDSLRSTMYADLLTYSQAREVLGVSRWTLSRLISDGKLSNVIVGGRYFVRHDALAAYIKRVKGEAPSTAPQPTARRTA